MIDFDIVIDDTLANVTSIDTLKSVLNKTVLSLVNDFEDAKWRQSKFLNFIWDNIAETALTEQERSALADKSHSSLVAAAKNLRLTDKDKKGEGSEIAEILLYGIMRKHYGALPVVPKIFYKQNVNDNAKGADSVHIVIKGDDFSLWFGEAKFYNSIEDERLGPVVASVYNALASDKLQKERSIITNVRDLDDLVLDNVLRQRIKDALKPSISIDHLKNRLNVPILLLHECSTTGGAVILDHVYTANMKSYHLARAESYFAKQLAKSDMLHGYKDIKFHIILFPVPAKGPIVAKFLNTVKFYKDS